MFRFMGSKMEPLTPELAEDFVTMRAFKGERPKKPHRLAFLSARLKDGQFHNPKWARAWLNGVPYRMNGQHSSQVLVDANGSFPAGLMAIIDEYKCDCEEDLAELFAQFDRRECVRSDGDITNAHARTEAELDGLSTRTIRNTVAGIAYALSIDGDEAVTPTADERARLVHKHKGYIIWASHFTGSAPFGRVAAAAAMFATFHANTSAAMEFWILVKEGSHPDNKHPSRVLAKFFDQNLTNAGMRARYETKAPWPTKSVYIKCIHAWNAFRRGTVTDLKVYVDSKVPKVER